MIEPRPTWICLILFGMTAFASCRPSEAPQQPTPPAAAAPSTVKPVAPESLMDKQIGFEFAVYYLPLPRKDPVLETNKVLNEPKAIFHTVKSIEKEPAKPVIVVRVENDPQAKYAPPNLDSLKYFGRGVSLEQAKRLQETKQVLLLDFAYPKQYVWRGMRSAIELTDAVAIATGGLIWDDETRQLFSPNEWQKQRIASWTGEIPEIAKHTTVHAYKKDQFVRAITLGLRKFGLPDVVVDQFPWGDSRGIGNMINLFDQAMAEGAPINCPGNFDLDFRTIRDARVRDPQVRNLKSNGTGVALLALKTGVWEAGDPMNRLIEIAFDRGTGPDLHAQQEDILNKAFGSEDSVTQVRHDEKLLAASRAARSKLPKLRDDFNKGLQPNETIVVKAPFARPDGGHEYMWVEVTAWKGDEISGILDNEPSYIPTLHAGQIVSLSESKVFDYIRKRADGTVEGNETGKLIEEETK